MRDGILVRCSRVGAVVDENHSWEFIGSGVKEGWRRDWAEQMSLTRV